MSVKEKIMAIIGITEEQYEKELAKNEYERAKMGCVSEYIDQRGKSMATGGNYITAAQAAQQAQLQSNQYAVAQAQGLNMSAQSWTAQPVNYRQTLGSTPKGLTPTFEQLEDPDSPFNLSLEALSVMWGARFGYRWVKDEDTADAIEENEEMWSLVASRLLEAGMLIHQQYRHPDKVGIGHAWKLIEKDHGNR